MLSNVFFIYLKATVRLIVNITSYFYLIIKDVFLRVGFSEHVFHF